MSYALARTLRADAARAAAYVSALGVPADGGRPAQEIVDAAVARLKTKPADEVAAWVERAERDAGGPVRPAWDGMMSLDELRAMAREGHEIGSHSYAHAILPACTDARLREEVVRSKADLAAAIGAPEASIESFCYPNGDHDDRVVRAVRDAGYARAVTTLWGTNAPGADRFRLRRCDVQGRTARTALGGLSPARMAFRLSGLYPGL